MLNSVSSAQRKLIMVRANIEPPVPADADESNHYFVFRTGENVQTVTAWLGLRKPVTASGTDAAYCEMQLYDGTTTITSGKAYIPAVLSGGFGTSWHRVALNTGGSLEPNTEYLGSIRQYHYGRVKVAIIYETASDVVDSDEDGATNPAQFELHKPIYDTAMQELAETATLLWKRNATQLLSWTREDVASAPSVSTTEVNLLDTSITGGTWSATTPGFVLNTQYHDSHNGDVPVVLGIYATKTAGNGDLTVNIKRNGSTIITRTISATGSPFDSSPYTIAARASDKIDITCQTSQGTWRIDAIGLWEYEA
jgi:hypothetical protein